MKPVILIAALALYALLQGCAGLRPAPVVTEVKVPVAVPCEAPMPAEPVFAVDLLPIGSDIHEQMKALRAERHQRRGYETELKAAAKACR